MASKSKRAKQEVHETAFGVIASGRLTRERAATWIRDELPQWGDLLDGGMRLPQHAATMAALLYDVQTTVQACGAVLDSGKSVRVEYRWDGVAPCLVRAWRCADESSELLGIMLEAAATEGGLDRVMGAFPLATRMVQRVRESLVTQRSLGAGPTSAEG